MKIRCLDKKDCFANADGYCICLTNNDFGGRRCSFYKTKTKAATERKKVEKQLKRKGKTGLIDMYNGGDNENICREQPYIKSVED